MNMFKKILLILVASVCIINAKTLPVESSLATGQLDNGFKYTIKKNKKPQDKVSLRLLVEAGSLEEDEDQLGVAHLVEHMAFNGTKNFKGNDLIKYLESIGVAFGSHLNANTGNTRTLYKLEVPLQNDNLEKTMLIFKDWAGGIDFTQEELDKERGVIVEEARSRNSVRYRMFLKAKDVYFANSKYAKRTPIGDMDIIKNISLERVKAFYDDWYRPELMHFAVVGDVDVKKVEKLIINSFKDLKNKSKRKQASREVPMAKETRTLIVKDKELTSYSVGVSFYAKSYLTKTEDEFRRDLIYTIMSKLFNTKGSEQSLKRNPAAKLISMRLGSLGTNILSVNFGTNFTGTNELKALEELTNLIYSIEKYGFDKKDFQRIVKNMKKVNKQSFKFLENKTSNSYADEIVSLEERGELFIDEKYKIELKDRLLSQITLEEINRAYKDILKSKSRLISYQLAPKAEVSKRRIKKILKTAKNKIKEQVKSKDLPTRIVDVKSLKPAKIVKETYNKKYDFYEFTLANGVKVAYKYNNYNKASVSLTAFSKGGFSIYDDKDLGNAQFALKVIGNSGYDKYNILDFKKIYGDKNIKFNPVLKRYGESFLASSTAKDFEYLLETIYLFSKSYRFDDNIFENTKHLSLSSLKKENKVPGKKFYKELMAYKYEGNKRFQPLKAEDIKNLDKTKMLEIYKDRFSDFNNFMFIVVGDISKDEVKKQITKFLGNLPVKKREENYNFRGIKPISGEHKFVRYFNNQNISDISLSYIKEAPYSVEESLKFAALTDILKTKLREVIREEKSGVYGVRVGGAFIREPYSHTAIDIAFTCDPKRKDELVKYIKKEIEKIKTSLVEEKYINSFIKKRLLMLEESKKKPRFWLAQLKKHYYYNQSLEIIDEYDDILKTISPIIIKETANKYLDTIHIFYTELNPKSLKK